MKRRGDRLIPWLLALFFFSGAAGIGYQLVWAKAFGAGIGHEYPAVLAVITAFLSGMALGGFLFERLPLRWQNAPRAYGWLELVIALWGASTIGLIPAINRAIIHALGLHPAPWYHWSLVYFAVFLTLLPATTAMGATLPAIERFLFSIREQKVTGLLYAANTAGAMMGGLIAAFWAISLIGIARTTLLFAAVNLLCALAAFWFGSGQSGVRELRPGRAHKGVVYPLAIRLFITGWLGIGFETVMIRALSHGLESTVYTFAVILAVYLLGAALGAAAHHRYFGRSRLFNENQLFVNLAFSCVLSGVLLRWTAPFYFGLRSALGDSLFLVALAEGTVAALVFLLPAFWMGSIFTDLAQRSLSFRPSLGWSVALNSAGSALAPSAFGLLLIPAIGLKGTLALVTLAYALMSPGAKKWLVPACAFSIPILTGSTELIARDQQTIPFFRDGVMASVAVLESTNSARVLKVNNRFQMGGTAARIAEQRHADLPLLLHPNPRRALFLGLGTGISFTTAANYPDLLSDGVELVPEVTQAMPYFQPDPGVLKDSALRVFVADARRFVLASTNLYDVIVGDLFHPAQDGAGFLFSMEHFAAVRERLQSDGLFCQWLPLYQLDLSTLEIITATFRRVFPNAELWLLRFNVDTPVVGLIGWKSTPEMSVNLVEAKAGRSQKLRDHLRTVALGDTLRLFGSRLGPAKVADSVPINTDEHPIIIFRAPFQSFRKKDDPAARLLALLSSYANSATNFSTPGIDSAFNARLASYQRARDKYLEGLAKESSGNVLEAVNLYIESTRISSEFTSGYAQALAIATSLAQTNPEAANAILQQLIEAQPDRPVARQLLERLQQPR